MSKLTKIAKLVRISQENQVADRFLQDLSYTIEKENERTVVPTQTYKPSSISGCKRALYYQMKGELPDVEPESITLIGICESGTARHEILQEYVMLMNEYGIECEWLDVGEYLKEKGITDPQVVSKRGNETKLYSEKYNMRFMCDGLIRYRGELYILEIKTESSRKFSSHEEAFPEHKLQAACYSMTLQVPKVIFIYENRDVCSKKAFLFEVPDTMVENIRVITFSNYSKYLSKPLLFLFS